MKIFAYQEAHLFTVTFTIYDHLKQIKRRTFYLRNLSGKTLEQQCNHAVMLANAIAQELHYLTGFGIDKAILTHASQAMSPIIFPSFPPVVNNETLRCSLKIFIQFEPPFTYQWVKGKRHAWAIEETEVSKQWTRQVVEAPYRAKSFAIPAILDRQHGFFSRLRDDRGFNRHDPTFQQFMRRFFETGNLSFGDYRYWGGQGKNSISYSSWPEARKLPKKQQYPRKSRLASQPQDTTDYVYIIQSGRSNVCKIGKSNDPKGRLVSLQTANSQKLRLTHIFEADNASAAEEELHRFLSASRLEGEWFQLSTQQLKILREIERFAEQQFWMNERNVSLEALLHEKT